MAPISGISMATSSVSSRLARRPFFTLAAATASLALTMLAGGAGAAPADPAAARVDVFDHALIEAMKGGASLGVKGRAKKLTPAVESAFDLATMTRVAVGPKWSEMSAVQQSALVAGFTRLSVASYAHNFDSYGGERFDLDPVVQTRGVDKIVQCKLIVPKDKPVSLVYRMRQTPDGWKIVDVIYDGVSQLTTRRSDFAQPVAAGGAAGLLNHLDVLTEKLLK